MSCTCSESATYTYNGVGPVCWYCMQTFFEAEEFVPDPEHGEERARLFTALRERYEQAHPPTEQLGPFNLTDTGNAERLVAMHGDEVRYVPGQGWYVWDGRRWASDDTSELMRRAKLTTRAVYHDAAECDDDDERKEILAWAKSSESEPRRRAMIKLASSERPMVVRAKQLDADPWALTVLNGTLDLRTGELRPHDPADLITKLAPVTYDPAASSDKWTEFLETVTNGQSELGEFLARAVGYTLTGSTREEKLFFPHGPTASGKSTFIESVQTALGDYGATADFETFLRKRGDGGIRNDIARLAGARLVTSIEVEDGKRLAEGLVKSLTGGDTVAARFLHREFFEFVPAFKLWLVANHRPKVRADDDAIWRRIVQMPFTHVISEDERDPSLKEQFKADKAIQAAILAWAVAGCLAWQRQGLAVPGLVTEYTAEYRAENDPLAGWIEDFCELGPEHWTPTVALRGSYERWCKAAGIEPIDTRNTWGPALERHNCEPEGGGRRGRGWRGIRCIDGLFDGLVDAVGNVGNVGNVDVD